MEEHILFQFICHFKQAYHIIVLVGYKRDNRTILVERTNLGRGNKPRSQLLAENKHPHQLSRMVNRIYRSALEGFEISEE